MGGDQIVKIKDLTPDPQAAMPFGRNVVITTENVVIKVVISDRITREPNSPAEVPDTLEGERPCFY